MARPLEHLSDEALALQATAGQDPGQTTATIETLFRTRDALLKSQDATNNLTASIRRLTVLLAALTIILVVLTLILAWPALAEFDGLPEVGEGAING